MTRSKTYTKIVVSRSNPVAKKRIALLANNKCMFPDCGIDMSIDSGIKIGEICHIHAYGPGGPRYNPNLSSDEVFAFENLIFLCPKHHHEIDSNPEKYTSNWLKNIVSTFH